VGDGVGLDADLGQAGAFQPGAQDRGVGEAEDAGTPGRRRWRLRQVERGEERADQPRQRLALGPPRDGGGEPAAGDQHPVELIGHAG
jgi:hypothetical protein